MYKIVYDRDEIELRMGIRVAFQKNDFGKGLFAPCSYIEGEKICVREILEISDIDAEQRLIKAVSLDPLTMKFNRGKIYFVGTPQETGVHGAELYHKNNKENNRIYILNTVFAKENFKRKSKEGWIDAKIKNCSTLESYIQRFLEQDDRYSQLR